MSIKPSAAIIIGISLSLTVKSNAAAAEGSGKEPIYIGSQACGRCHGGLDMGNQFTRWRLSSHARAYASLALPEAKEIARLSGITEPPESARMCLGCHATASDEEDWRRGEEFHLGDGLQCEACHGPGSEYARVEVMTDQAESVANGLLLPDRTESCMRCHRVKGSHEAVLKKKPFDVNEAWATIAHQIPPSRRGKPHKHGDRGKLPDGAGEAPHKFTGVMACADCHEKRERGLQFSAWRRGPHARAYAVLSTARGFEIAADEGVKCDPQESPQCLKCHSTGAGYSTNSFVAGFDVRDGVQCEACHGPGSDYSPEPMMLDKAAAHARASLR
jgi:cytochrome c553